MGHEKELAYSWLNKQIKAFKLANSVLPHEQFGYTSGILYTDKHELHIGGVFKIAEIIGADVIREDWDGNEQCKTNHDIVYFWYRGFKIFQLVDKETDDEGK